jgi:hypothetical protein
MLGRLWSTVHTSTNPKWTFNSRLFPAVKKACSFSAEVATLLSAAKLEPEAVFKSLSDLDGKTFTDQASFENVIAATLGINAGVLSGQDALAAVIYWMALLIYPKPPPAPNGVKAMPRPPLVPTVSDVSIAYTATTVLDFVGGTSTAPGWDRLWQITPFATYPRPTNNTGPLLSVYENGGYLYLGLEGIEPPETISLLFIMEPMAAPALSTLSDDDPSWSLLTGDLWTDVTPAVHDGTGGFVGTGIARIEIPMTADTSHTVMPSGLVWLRIHVKNPAAHLRTLQVLPHAVEAAWAPPVATTPEQAIAISKAHFSQPLPAGAITGLVLPDPNLPKVVQPLPSVGGSPAETTDEFCTRVSERLRHKNRAVASGDYERLVLQRFPNVFFARSVAPAKVEAAGSVTLIVLPRVPKPPGKSPPGFIAADLRAMEDALSASAPLSASIEVINPSYQAVQVSVPDFIAHN